MAILRLADLTGNQRKGLNFVSRKENMTSDDYLNARIIELCDGYYAQRVDALNSGVRVKIEEHPEALAAIIAEVENTL